MTALRVPFAVGSGGLLSLSIFWLLWMFVDVPLSIGNMLQPTAIIFTPQRVDTPVVTKRQEKIVREPPPQIVDPPRIGPGDRGVEQPTPFVPPVVAAGGIPKRTMVVGPDRDAIPLVRVDPDYPSRAIALGAEGWVQVQFSITATGAVRDAYVVAADPKNLFEDAALKAIARWRYQPKIDGGVAVERVGLQAVIRFTLEQ